MVLRERHHEPFSCVSVANLLWKWLFEYCPKREMLGVSGLVSRLAGGYGN